jgi:S-formylglutathione hydrolase FrmB
MSLGPFVGPPARRRGRGRPLLGVLLVLVVAAGVVAGVVAATRDDGPDRRGGDVETFRVRSRLVDRTLEQKAAVPATGATSGRPLLILLHGRGAQPGSAFSDPFWKELERLGPRAPVVVEVNGGEGSYYHDRDSGRWGSYVTREAIPAAERRYRTDPDRVAIGGTSMGGFGALDIARQNPRSFCAVGGHSAALWEKAKDTAPGAFDDASDFRRHDLIAYAKRDRRAFAGETLWLDVGRDDPFRTADAALVRQLNRRDRDLTWHLYPGGHGGAYFRAHVADYLRFYAAALESCRT